MFACSSRASLLAAHNAWSWGAGAQQNKWLFDQATVVEALLKCPPVQAVLPTDDAARESLRQRMLADYMTHDEAHSRVDGMDGEGLPGDGMVRMRRLQQLVCGVLACPFSSDVHWLCSLRAAWMVMASRMCRRRRPRWTMWRKWWMSAPLRLRRRRCCPCPSRS